MSLFYKPIKLEPKIRVAYVYFVNLADKTANVSQTLNMLTAFKNQLLQVQFISSWISRKKMDKTLGWHNISTTLDQVRIPVIIHKGSRIQEFLGMGIYCLGVWIMVQIKNYDLIYTRDFSFLYFLSSLPPFLRPKVKIFFEAHKIYHLVSNKVNLTQERRSLAIPDHIITVSQKIKDDLGTYFSIDDTKISVYPNGANPDQFDQSLRPDKSLGQQYPATQGANVVLYSGSFVQWKGVDSLIRAIKLVQDRNCIFLLVGVSGKDKSRITALAEKEEVLSNLVLVDLKPQAELYQLIMSATLGVIPNIDYLESRYSSPLKLFEYLGAGLPIVASNLGSIQEILTEPDNCVFFMPGDEMDLARRIDQLLQDATLRSKMSQENRQLAEKYSWHNRAVCLVNLFQASHGA